MEIQEFVTLLSNKPTIVDKDTPTDITEELHDESFSSDDNFISIKSGDSEFSIEFEVYASWEVKNSGGDGYIDPNYDYPVDVDVEIDLLNIEDYENDIIIELNDKESVKEIENWINAHIEQ